LGLDEPINIKKWTTAGIAFGKERNIAWRVMDAKYFGLPQQRIRIYLLGGGKDFHPENVLFEVGNKIADPYKEQSKIEYSLRLFDDHEEKPQTVTFELTKDLNGHQIEAFRSYSDCLYAAYGTKWNGNAAAFNGSLYFSQNGKLRRLSPLECERLQTLPDNYTA
jgi:DNA (cytosine-5)-methyltransferase 1